MIGYRRNIGRNCGCRKKIEKLAEEANFALLACYDFFEQRPRSTDSERWQFVLRKNE